MKLNRLKHINELLTEQMNHWLFFPMALTVAQFSRELTAFRPGMFFLLWAVCGLFPPVFFILRKKGGLVSRTFLLHFAVAACSLLIPVRGRALYRVICVSCVLVYMILSLRRRLKKDSIFSGSLQLPAAVAVVCLAAAMQFILQNDAYQVDSYLRDFSIASLILCLALYFIIMYIQQYMNFLNVNADSAGYLPASEIFHSGLGLVGIYTLIGAFIMWFSTHLTLLQDIVNLIKEPLYRLLRWILERLAAFSEKTETIPTEYEDVRFPEEIAFPESKTFWLWEFLQFAFVLLFLFLAVYVLVRLLMWLVALLQGRILTRRETEDEAGERIVDVRESCDPEAKNPKKNRRRFGPLSNAEKVRRLYRKKLLSSLGQMTVQEREGLDLHTAREWERRLSADGMAALYERSRYSEEEINAEDVRKMRDACRKEQAETRQQ